MFPQFATMGEAPADTTPQPQFIEESFKAVASLSLAQDATYPDLRVSVDSDGDFVVTDVYATQTGPYQIQFKNAAGRNLSTAPMSNANAIGTAQFPVPFGAVIYPAGGQIAYSITNKYAGVNNIELVFSGVKRRRVR